MKQKKKMIFKLVWHYHIRLIIQVKNDYAWHESIHYSCRLQIVIKLENAN